MSEATEYLRKYIKEIREQSQHCLDDPSEFAAQITAKRHLAALKAFDRILNHFKDDPHPTSHPVIREIVKAMGMEVIKEEKVKK